jgi:hypothetical protein
MVPIVPERWPDFCRVIERDDLKQRAPDFFDVCC